MTRWSSSLTVGLTVGAYLCVFVRGWQVARLRRGVTTYVGRYGVGAVWCALALSAVNLVRHEWVLGGVWAAAALVVLVRVIQTYDEAAGGDDAEP